MFKPVLSGLAASLTIAALFATVSAEARTSYILPYNFAPTDAYVTAEAATSENLFIPEGALKVDGFQIIDDKGAATTAKSTQFKEVTLFETALPHEGTFRLTTGNVEMRSMQMVELDGQWRPVRGPGGPGGPGGGQGGAAPQGQGAPGGGQMPPPPAIPADARTVTVKGMSRADSYISLKKPSDSLPPLEGKGLEVAPVTHPSRLFAGGTFDFAVVFDGKPLPAADFKIERGGDQYRDASYVYTGTTGADGKAQVTFETPGVYVIELNRKWQDGDQSDPRSWSYSLTIEVAP
ncbi:MAG: DUF4198 domain-containing protein [Asticcacaulis sp.]|uniref:DUF4198 domain-containing protein n=1 Tax=Asticcacaulis sp. TaxID=1872648 RepID=UPI0039E58FBC